MMGEFQISNLPLIIIAIVLISIGVLGYFEIKKLYIKLNSIVTKIDEINEILPKNQSGIPRPPPHIIEQQRMMMQRQQQQQQQQQQQMHKMQQMNKVPEELNMPQDTNDNSEKDLEDDINHDEYSDDYSSTDDDIRSSEDKGDEENPFDVESKKSSVLEDITNLSDNSQHNSQHNSHTSEMTIELDNEFKHLSIKELKDLCKEKDLPVSGNKSTLISRLLEKTN